MHRWLILYSCLFLPVSIGCTLCANPHDCKYAAYGGVRDRANHARGRVGSVFDPADEVRVEGISPAAESIGEPTLAAPPTAGSTDPNKTPVEGENGEAVENDGIPETIEQPKPSHSTPLPPGINEGQQPNDDLPTEPTTPEAGELPEVPGDEMEFPSASSEPTNDADLSIVPAGFVDPLPANSAPLLVNPLGDLFDDES